MAAFSKLAVWPVGYFRAYSSWLLRSRREVAARLDAISAELDRIGFVKIYYQQREQTSGLRATEEVLGIDVTKGSSLAMLLQAYIVAGGNPLDICPFTHPDFTVVTGTDETGSPTLVEEYPQSGLAAPASANPNEPLPVAPETGYGAYPGGFVPLDGYYPKRQGGRTSPGAYDHDSVVRTMRQIREWNNQTIKERIQDIGWRIIKLCDLREQLTRERDDMLWQAFGGALTCLAPLDDSRIDPSLRVQNLVQDMYQLLYTADDAGVVQSYTANSQVAFLGFTFPSTPSEVGRAG